jgi:hypothetical protein
MMRAAGVEMTEARVFGNVLWCHFGDPVAVVSGNLPAFPGTLLLTFLDQSCWYSVILLGDSVH